MLKRTWWLFIGCVLFTLTDWLLLLLPAQFGISFAPNVIVPLGFTFIARLMIVAVVCSPMVLASWVKRGPASLEKGFQVSVILFVVLNLAITAMEIDG